MNLKICIFLAMFVLFSCKTEPSQLRSENSEPTLAPRERPGLDPSTMVSLISCPQPAEIRSAGQPKSTKALFTADSHGVTYHGSGPEGLSVSKLEFTQAEVSHQNDRWQLLCIYHQNDMKLTLVSNENPRFEYCQFRNKAKLCPRSDEECILVCPAAP